MIYINNYNKKANKMLTILSYNTEFNINFNEICALFSMSEDELMKLINSPDTKKIYEKSTNQINNIIKNKAEKFNIDRYKKAMEKYKKELILLVKINRLIKSSKDKNYKFMNDDLLNITKYRITYGINREQAAEIFNTSSNKLYNYEKTINDEIIKREVEQENDYNNGIKFK